MRHFIFSLFVLAAFGLSAVAQQPTPKPKPKARKQFVSAEGGFTVNFPGGPTKKVKQVDSAFGKTSLTSYELVTVSAHFMVMIMDMPTVISDEAELDVRFDMIQRSISERPGTKLVEQRRIYVGESLGREFTVEIAGNTTTMRVFPVKHRFFQLSVATRGLISKASAAARKLHENKAGDFFDSFAATDVPDAAQVTVELPEDFGISIKDEKFRCDYFGFTMTLPAGWTILSDEQNDLLMELGRAEAKAQKPLSARQLNLSLKNTRLLVSSFNQSEESAGSVVVAAERVAFPNFLASAAVDSFVRSGLDPGEVVIKKKSSAKLGGLEFWWVETGKPNDKERQRFYVTNRGGIALQILIGFSTPQDLATALASLESVRFDPPAAAK